VKNQKFALFFAQFFDTHTNDFPMEVIEAVKNVHASVNTKQHCIYMYFFLGISKTKLATLFNKAESRIGEWIKRYEDGEGLGRKKRDIMERKRENDS
jgi:uncharacterized protein YgfB (UPF0149 family)